MTKMHVLEGYKGESIVFDPESLDIYNIDSGAADVQALIEEISKNTNKRAIKYKAPKEDYIAYLIIGCAEACNLACTYCFAAAGTYNAPTSIMNDNDYAKLLDLMLSWGKPLESICFFGGEPLMGFKYIKIFVENVEKEYSKKGWEFPSLGIVTNGTLIDEEVIAFFEKYRVSVSISIDGPKSINDKARIYPNNSGSVFESIVNNVSKSKDRDVKITASAVLSSSAFEEYEKMTFDEYIMTFPNSGFEFASLFIADEPIVSQRYYEHIEKFSKDMVEWSFDKLLKGEMLEWIPLMVLFNIESIVKGKATPVCAAGRKNFFYSAAGEGGLYPCHLYYMQRTKEISPNLSRDNIEACKDCIAKVFCHSYCAGSSLNSNGNELSVVETRCVYQRALVNEILKHLSLYLNDPAKKETLIANIIKASKISHENGVLKQERYLLDSEESVA